MSKFLDSVGFRPHFRDRGTRMTMTERGDHWKQVYSGHVIPAGQPYALRDAPDSRLRVYRPWVEYINTQDRQVPYEPNSQWFVDTRWKPPVDLPTKPTRGILLWGDGNQWFETWWVDAQNPNLMVCSRRTYEIDVKNVVDFVPLTPEQDKRVGAVQ